MCSTEDPKISVDSDWDAIILARAGVERLGLQDHISSIIPIDMMLPAVGQGALGLQIREGDNKTNELISVLHNPNIFAAVSCKKLF